MQNYLKYGKISELCGINVYFLGGKKKSAPAAPKISHFYGGGWERMQLLVRIYSLAQRNAHKTFCFFILLLKGLYSLHPNEHLEITNLKLAQQSQKTWKNSQIKMFNPILSTSHTT